MADKLSRKEIKQMERAANAKGDRATRKRAAQQKRARITEAVRSAPHTDNGPEPAVTIRIVGK